MQLKQFDLNLGFVNLFASLLPGTILSSVLLIAEWGHPNWFPGIPPLYAFAFAEDSIFLFWAAFLLISFGLGYYVNSMAGGLDVLYDRIRKRIYPYKVDVVRAIKKTRKNTASSSVPDSSAKITDDQIITFFSKHFQTFFPTILYAFFEFKTRIRMDNSYEHASHLMKQEAPGVQNSTNAFKWTSTMLEAYFPQIALDVNRTLAISKFFRSIVMISLIIFLFQLLGLLPRASFFFILNTVLLIFSFREYVVQRHKSTQKAYRAIVTLFHTPERILAMAQKEKEEKT